MGACLGCFRTEVPPPRRSPTAELHVVPAGRQNVAEGNNLAGVTNLIPFCQLNNQPAHPFCFRDRYISRASCYFSWSSDYSRATSFSTVTQVT